MAVGFLINLCVFLVLAHFAILGSRCCCVLFLLVTLFCAFACHAHKLGCLIASGSVVVAFGFIYCYHVLLDCNISFLLHADLLSHHACTLEKFFLVMAVGGTTGEDALLHEAGETPSLPCWMIRTHARELAVLRKRKSDNGVFNWKPQIKGMHYPCYYTATPVSHS